MLLVLSSWLCAAACFAACPGNATADQVREIFIQKQKRKLSLLRSDGSVLCEFEVALGSHPRGPKLQAGDGKTPEGEYTVQLKRDRGDTRFYRGFYLSYPNELDRRRAAARGVSPGADILIHGLEDKYRRLGRLHRLRDWTKGCIAVTDEEMDEMWPLVRIGTRIVIAP